MLTVYVEDKTCVKARTERRVIDELEKLNIEYELKSHYQIDVPTLKRMLEKTNALENLFKTKEFTQETFEELIRDVRYGYLEMKSPILFDKKRLMVGRNLDKIGAFQSRAKKKLKFREAKLKAAASLAYEDVSIDF